MSGHMASPCPSWCVLPADHDAGSNAHYSWNGAFTRMHSGGTTEAGGDHEWPVDVLWFEHFGPGWDTVDPPVISTNAGLIDAEMARSYAAALLAAADKLDSITDSVIVTA